MLVEVQMLTVAAGPQGVLQIGAKVWLTEEAAALYETGGYGKKTGRTQAADTGQATVETATTQAPERAVSQRGRRGKNA